MSQNLQLWVQNRLLLHPEWTVDDLVEAWLRKYPNASRIAVHATISEAVSRR